MSPRGLDIESQGQDDTKVTIVNSLRKVRNNFKCVYLCNGYIYGSMIFVCLIGLD